MSLVADVLASVTQKSDTSAVEMERLFKECEEAKVTICQTLGSRYVDLSNDFGQTLVLEERLGACIKEISQLDVHIKNEVIPCVEGSASEIERVKLRCLEMKLELEVTEILLRIHTMLEKSLTAQVNGDFDAAVIALRKVEDFLMEANSHEVASMLDIMSALREELVLKRTDLVYVMGEAWDKFISFSDDPSPDSEASCCLMIQDFPEDDDKNLKHVSNMFSALHKLGELQGHMRPLAKNIFRWFIKPLLCENGKLKVFSQGDSGLSTMYVQKSQTPGKIQDPASAIFAINQLEMMFKFLHGHLSRYSIQKDTEVISLVSLLGAEIEGEFIELILSSCLEESVPSDRKDLKGFTEVQLKVEEFHNFLVNIDFYTKEHTTLLNYVANVETVYGNKTCASILVRARNLIAKPLHVKASVGLLQPGGSLVVQDDFGTELKQSTARLQNLSPNSFNFPECKVSVSVCELVNLIYNTLDEACSSVAEFAVRLFHAVRNILSLYLHVTPVAHAEELSTSLECAALVHNNGMFLAHHSLLLGHHYQKKFPLPPQEISLTTADLGYLIRSSGVEVFLKGMQGHKATLLDTLRKGMESSLIKSDITSVTPLHSSVEECLLLLERLRGAWRNVLPHSVYIKSMGTLTGSLVEDLVHRITSLEEISADDAIGLVNVLALLTSSVPALFDEENPASPILGDNVRLWDKMRELVVVLAASLRDLDERWRGGKGPLAQHFSAGEVKHLIKAIFQNTERRAKLLARIK